MQWVVAGLWCGDHGMGHAMPATVPVPCIAPSRGFLGLGRLCLLSDPDQNRQHCKGAPRAPLPGLTHLVGTYFGVDTT